MKKAEREMMRKHTAMALAALALATAAGAANAEFLVQGTAAAQSAPATQTVEAIRPAMAAPSRAMAARDTGAGVHEVGNMPQEPQAAKGFARSVPLLTALKQITPSGWRARRVGDLDLSAKVSWRADGRSWVEVLDELAHEQGFSATVNWDRQELVVAPAGSAGDAPVRESIAPAASQAPQASANPGVVARVDSGRPASTVREEIAPAAPRVVVAKPLPIKVAQPTWTLSADKTLRQNIEAWGKQAGWTVSWDPQMPDYPITVPVTFVGALDSQGGPLYQLALAYKEADQPLTIRMMRGNHTIRVEKLDYDQQPNQDFMPEHRASQD
jgi:hypothetical protein